MTDNEYDFLVASHGDAVPPRERIRLHDNQILALDSLLRVMRELGIDREVRITGIFAQAGGRTRIFKEFAETTTGTRRFDLEFSFLIFEADFMNTVLGEDGNDDQ